MSFSPPGVYAVCLLAAFVPAGISWWSGTRLTRRLDDPSLPDLLAEHRRRNGVTLGVVVGAVGCFAAVSTDGFALPLMLAGTAYAALIAAAYPVRRTLYHETWSFGSYCLYYARATAALFGFWLALGALPAVVSVGGDRGWLLAIATGGVLLLWNRRKAEIVRWALRTAPLAEGELLEGCRALAVASGLPHTRFERINLQGGVFVNALALPSLTVPSVLFTDTLLERFERREVFAICAHELAHFDYYTPSRVRHLDRVNDALVGLGVLAAPAATLLGTAWGVSLSLLWCMVIVFAIATRARGRQRQETQCDLRAVELTGDAEALISGLTKLYTIARMPRRLAQQTEQAATHPSLARRIRDLRRAGGLAPASLSSARSFASSDDRVVVTFHDAEVQWAEHSAVTHVMSYSHLTELRIVARPGRHPRLVAVGAEARRWEMPLRPDDAGAVQEVLDIVDGKLADPPSVRALPPRLRRLVIASSAIVVFAFAQWSVALAAALAFIKPGAPLLVAAGLAAETAAAVMVRDATATESLIVALPLAGMGAILLALAWSHRDAPQDGTRIYLCILAIAAVCALAGIFIDGIGVVRLHRSARSLPSATLLLVALAGALACSTIAGARRAAMAATLAALVSASIASTTFLDTFSADPFVIGAPPVRWVALPSAPIQAFDVPFDTTSIVLSQDGRYVAILENADEDTRRPATLQAGRVGERLASIEADDAAFVQDDELLLVRPHARGTQVETRRLASSSEVIWQRTVENLSAPSLSFDAGSRRWDLLGWEDENFILRVEGILESGSVAEQRWPWREGRDLYVAAMTSAGRGALVVQNRYDRSLVARLLPPRWSWAQMLLPTARASRYGTIGIEGLHTLGETRLDLDCAPQALPGAALACTAYDGSRTRIVTISAAGGVDPVAMVDGRFVTTGSCRNGWLTGWSGSRPVAIRLATAEAFYLPHGRIVRLLPVGADRLAAIVAVGKDVAALIYSTTSDARGAESVASRRLRVPPVE